MRANVCLLDIGNTSIKACALSVDEAFDNIQTVSPIAVYDDVQTWIDSIVFKPHCKVIIASVRSESENQAILQALAAQGFKVQSVATEKRRFGLTNSYANESKMGVDRWLAMLGAQLLCPEPFVVLDAGTAITVDGVADGQHLGGWIVPGFQLAQQAVTGNTRRVFQASFDDTNLTFGQDTEACLHYGCVAQANGLLAMAEHIMSKIGKDYRVVISGGDQLLFKQSTSDAPRLFVTNIVFVGLLRYAMAEFGLEKQQIAAQSLDI